MHKILILPLLVGTIGFNMAAYATDDNTPSPSTVTSLGYVNTQLGTKQNNIPARNANLTESVVTYTGTAGSVGEKGVYQDSGSYNSTTQQHLVEAATVNTAIQNGLNNHLEEVQNEYGTLWRIKTLNGTYIPHGS